MADKTHNVLMLGVEMVYQAEFQSIFIAVLILSEEVQLFQITNRLFPRIRPFKHLGQLIQNIAQPLHIKLLNFQRV